MSSLQFDRMEQEIEDAYQRGEISLKEYNEEVRELRRDFQIAAEEAAQRAYDNEMARWP